MATLDQLNWEKNNPGIPFNPTGPVGNRGMTPEQIASERFKESGGKSSLPGNSGTAGYPAAGTDAVFCALTGTLGATPLTFGTGTWCRALKYCPKFSDKDRAGNCRENKTETTC